MEKVEIETKEEGKKERGAGLVEYALLVALVVGMAISARTFLSGRASTTFSTANSQMTNF